MYFAILFAVIKADLLILLDFGVCSPFLHWSDTDPVKKERSHVPEGMLTENWKISPFALKGTRTNLCNSCMEPRTYFVLHVLHLTQRCFVNKSLCHCFENSVVHMDQPIGLVTAEETLASLTSIYKALIPWNHHSKHTHIDNNNKKEISKFFRKKNHLQS